MRHFLRKVARSAATLAIVAGFALTSTAEAQFVNLRSAGCSSFFIPAVTGGTSPGDTFEIDCGCPPTALSFLMIGACLPTMIALDPPLTCRGGCMLAVSPTISALIPMRGSKHSITLPNNTTAGSQLCMQCVCVDMMRMGPPCVNISTAWQLTVTP